eukprot:1161781-Pelagomonas_calceolata.AAC.15
MQKGLLDSYGACIERLNSQYSHSCTAPVKAVFTMAYGQGATAWYATYRVGESQLLQGRDHAFIVLGTPPYHLLTATSCCALN